MVDDGVAGLWRMSCEPTGGVFGQVGGWMVACLTLCCIRVDRHRCDTSRGHPLPPRTFITSSWGHSPWSEACKCGRQGQNRRSRGPCTCSRSRRGGMCHRPCRWMVVLATTSATRQCTREEPCPPAGDLRLERTFHPRNAKMGYSGLTAPRHRRSGIPGRADRRGLGSPGTHPWRSAPHALTAHVSPGKGQVRH